jgi:hypothetical protein
LSRTETGGVIAMTYPQEPSFRVGPDGRAFNKEGAFKEYDARVQEIRAIEAGIHQFVGIIMAAIAAITAAGMNTKVPYLFLVTFVLLIIANLYVTEKRWVIWLNAAYIRKYLENEQTGIWWEHRLGELREGTRSPVGGIKRVEFWMFILVGCLEVFLFVWFDWSDLDKDLRALVAGNCYLCQLKHLLPFGFLVTLVLLVNRNFEALRTGKAEIRLLAALPGDSSLLRSSKGHDDNDRS